VGGTITGWQPSGLDGERVLPARLRALVDILTAELAGRLPWPADRVEIGESVAAALLDLRGSVAFDSLAEMACRLAEHRLVESHRQAG